MDIKNTIYKQMLLQTQTPLLALLSVGNDCLYALQMSVSAEQFRKPWKTTSLKYQWRGLRAKAPESAEVE